MKPKMSSLFNTNRTEQKKTNESKMSLICTKHCCGCGLFPNNILKKNNNDERVIECVGVK